MSTKLLNPEHATIARLDRWVTDGWLRPLDRALAALLLSEGGEDSDKVLVLAALTSQQLGQGDICLDLARASSAPAALFARMPTVIEGDSPLHWLARHASDDLYEALRHSPVVANERCDSPAPLVLDGDRLYLRRYHEYETRIAGQLLARLDSTLPAPDRLRDRLDALFPQRSDVGTDWQKIACALATRSRFTLITGGPGTGKTTTVVRLLGLLQSVALEQNAPLRIRLAAPTGKAAARLKSSISGAISALPLSDSIRSSIPAEVSTLHKLLGSRPDSRRFRHDRHHPLHADLVVVDEASMMDLEMTASLLDALRPDARLILLGDKDQLSSVEAGAVLGNLCLGADAGNYSADTCAWLSAQTGESVDAWRGEGIALAQQTVMLRHSHRFAADSGIGQLARAVNQDDSEALQRIWQSPPQDVSRLVLLPDQYQPLEEQCVAGYRHYLEQLEQQRPNTSDAVSVWADTVLHGYEHFQLLCALRDGDTGVSGLNRRVAAALHQAGLISRNEGWYEGRPVIMTRNDYQLGLMNGDVGITLNLASDDGTSSLRVAFRLPDGRITLVLPSRLDGVESVYAMTVHKSQGSEFRHAALVLPASAQAVSRELLYTAITRARSHFTLVGTAATLSQPARPTLRASGLADRLSPPAGLPPPQGHGF
ncbi:MAG: exodeoxyribonuclease V subunit alpha [Alcanivoracaceae bacterium]